MGRIKKNTYVGQAAVGLGLYAKRTLRNGKRIGRVRGIVLDDPDYTSEYCIDLGGPFSLEPTNAFRFLNHSCEPNCEFLAEDLDDGSSRVDVYATRDIAAGEQLTIDYAWPADNAIPCFCGAKRCRGWVVASQEIEVIERAHSRKQQRSSPAWTS